MNVYPSILPAAAVEQLVKAALKPAEIKTKELVAASYQLLGYVLGQSVGEPGSLIGEAGPDVQLRSLELLADQLNHPLVTAGPITKNEVATIIAKHIVMLTVELLKKPGQPVV